MAISLWMLCCYDTECAVDNTLAVAKRRTLKSETVKDQGKVEAIRGF